MAAAWVGGFLHMMILPTVPTLKLQSQQAVMGCGFDCMCALGLNAHVIVTCNIH